LSAEPAPFASAAEDLEVSAEQAIAACGGDAREAVDFLEAEANELRAAMCRKDTCAVGMTHSASARSDCD
jgi:hypothetical protein